MRINEMSDEEFEDFRKEQRIDSSLEYAEETYAYEHEFDDDFGSEFDDDYDERDF